MAGSRASASSASTASPAAVRSAIERGVRRLEAAAHGGYWTGFPTLAGRSDVWVTAFTAAHLARVAPRHAALGPARRYLLGRQQASGGWGYGGRGVPADADSTAWCLVALGGSKAVSGAARSQARVFLAAHASDQGFRTYRADGGIREFIAGAPEASLAGWTAAHPDVTAAVLLTDQLKRGSPDARRLLEHLLARQTVAGFIEAYWWRTPLYTLAMTLRALRHHHFRPDAPFLGRALEGLEAKRLPSGAYSLGGSDQTDALSTALALEVLEQVRAAKTAKMAAQPVVDALLSVQRPDGGWEGAAVLRIPAPSVTRPHAVQGWKLNTGGGNSFVDDQGGVFATALACHALSLSLARHEGRFPAWSPSWPELHAPAPLQDSAAIAVPVIVPPEFERCNV